VKELYSKIFLLVLDLCAIFISILIGYLFRDLFSSSFEHEFGHTLTLYLSLWMLYAFPIGLMSFEGIYTRRYDFWHESRLVIKALFMSFILILAILAMTKTMDEYSRATILFIFLSMSLFVPLFKNIGKKYLYKIGIWQRKVKIYSQDRFLSNEIKDNHYLGYIEVKDEEPKTVFINSIELGISDTQKILEKEIKKRHEVIFIPLINDYNLTHSFIYELSNTRTNLIVFQNRLKSRYRIILKQVSEYSLTLFLFPFLIPIMLFIAYRIKQDNPDEKIFFKQKRLGKNVKPFSCYKFQTMYEKSDALLENYLKEHPEEIDYYETYHKYKNDPRVTKAGHFLRRTSLDELPQIFNVFGGDMSFIGPRPYMLNEEKEIGEEIETILSVKPGITGLWQVSGRSDVNFHSRVELDVWYIRNWNLWMDLIILIKTIKTVLLKDGAN